MVIEAIGDYLEERLSNRDCFFYEKLPGGDCIIEFLTQHPSLKSDELSTRVCHISLSDGLAVVTLGNHMVRYYEFSDPAFPENLLGSLPP